jgi:predicted aspartyl protease
MPDGRLWLRPLEGVAMPQRFAVICMVLMISAIPCEGALHGEDVVDFALDEHGGIIMPVFIGGQGPFRFLLDTGSSASSVSESFAARIGAAAVAKAEIGTAAGRTVRPVVQLPRVTIGSAAADSLLASVLPDDVVSAVGRMFDGILGQDFLAPHNYTLDYRSRTLTWRTDTNDEPGTRLTLVRRNVQVLVELPQNRGRIVRLVPDSGADSLVLFTQERKTPVDVDAVAGVVTLDSLAGRSRVRPVSVRELKLGNLTLRNQPAVAVERRDAASQEGDGLLPLHYFQKVTFNAAGYVVLQH